MNNYLENIEERTVEPFNEEVKCFFNNLVTHARQNNNFTYAAPLMRDGHAVLKSIAETINSIFKDADKANSTREIEKLRPRVGDKGIIILASESGYILSFSNNPPSKMESEVLTTSSRNVIHFIVDGKVKFVESRAPADFNPARFDPHYNFGNKHETFFSKNDMVTIDADQSANSSFSLTSNQIFSFCSPTVSDYEHTIAAGSLTSLYMSYSVIGDAILEKIFELSHSFVNIDDLPKIKAYTTHRNYRVRWAALKAMMNIDSSNIEDYLDIGLSDQHPAVKHLCGRIKAECN